MHVIRHNTSSENRCEREVRFNIGYSFKTDLPFRSKIRFRWPLPIIGNPDHIRERRKYIRLIKHYMIDAPAPIIMPGAPDTGIRMFSREIHVIYVMKLFGSDRGTAPGGNSFAPVMLLCAFPGRKQLRADILNYYMSVNRNKCCCDCCYACVWN